MTKHGFLDKIKAAAGAASSGKGAKKEEGGEKEDEGKNGSNWDALKDDYMLNPKKVRDTWIQCEMDVILKGVSC